QEIVRNVSQAAAGTGEVTGNIAGVAGAAEETGAAASQVLGAASELSRQSEYLSAEVASFLDTVRAA
ncbi:methyl-accepting chemotaxis protein, partial [Methylobacterium frigidaeris]